MDLQLSGRRAFVSGSTEGIGYAIALALAAEGAAVILNGRRHDRLQEAVTRLQSEVPQAAVSGLAADFGRPEQVAELLQLLQDIDILVNNVGVFDVKAFGDIDDAEWRHYLEVNVMSAVGLSRHLLPGMLSKDWGRVLFISSESGVNIPADMIHYGVTKAAMIALSNGLAKLTRGSKVTVNTILGGPTYSDGVARTVNNIAHGQGMEEVHLKAAIIGSNTSTLLQRFIEPNEIAHLAAFLASPLSSATNGAAVRADGGVLTQTL